MHFNLLLIFNSMVKININYMAHIQSPRIEGSIIIKICTGNKVSRQINIYYNSTHAEPKNIEGAVIIKIYTENKVSRQMFTIYVLQNYTTDFS
jgi:hypothetical protein